MYGNTIIYIIIIVLNVNGCEFIVLKCINLLRSGIKLQKRFKKWLKIWLYQNYFVPLHRNSEMNTFLL